MHQRRKLMWSQNCQKSVRSSANKKGNIHVEAFFSNWKKKLWLIFPRLESYGKKPNDYMNSVSFSHLLKNQQFSNHWITETKVCYAVSTIPGLWSLRITIYPRIVAPFWLKTICTLQTSQREKESETRTTENNLPKLMESLAFCGEKSECKIFPFT